MKDRDNYNFFGNGNDQSKDSSNRGNFKFSIFDAREIDRPIKIGNNNKNNEIFQQELKDIKIKDDDLSAKDFKTQITKKSKKKKNNLYKSVNLNIEGSFNPCEEEDKKQIFNNNINESNDNSLNNNNINNFIINNNNSIKKENNNKRDNEININNNIIKDNSHNNINNKEDNNIINNFKIQNDDNLALKEKLGAKDINSREIKNNKHFRKNSYDLKKKHLEEEKKKKLQQDNLAQVSDQIKCYICYEIIKNPKMCKYCNRFACEQCLIAWFKSKNICGFCKKSTNLEEMIKIPFLDDKIYNYLYNQVNEVNNNEFSENGQNKENAFKDDNTKDDIKGNNSIVKYDSNICEKHGREYESYCVNCKQNLCSNCTLFFDRSSLIHNGHVIVKIKNNECKEELIKLNEKKKSIDDLINLLNLKIRELEIEKNQNLVYIDDIKKNLNKEYDDIIDGLKKEYNIIENKRDECANSLETLPYALKNIIELNDNGQEEKILEHIQKINKLDIKEIKKINFKNNFIESFKTEEKSFILPENGNNNEGQAIYEVFSNDFIPNYTLKYLFKYINQYTNIAILLENNNNNIIEDKVKFYGFIIFKFKNYNSEFVKLENKSLNSLTRHLLHIKISTNDFIKFKDESNIIRFKLYIFKYSNK